MLPNFPKQKGLALIYAPTDAVLENIVYARRGGPSTLGEYGLYIRLSCDMIILFDHIDKVSDELKEKYYAKIGETIEKSTGWEFIPAEDCGQLSRDKSGTISGGWFKGESTDTKGDYSPKIFPGDVKVGEEVCYFDQNQNRWVFVKLVSDNQLSLARGTGSCPTSFSESQFEVWER